MLTKYKAGDFEPLNKIQEVLQCCGVKGPGDFEGKKPESCKEYTEGCVAKLEGYLNDTKGPVFITGIITLVLLVCIAIYGRSCQLVVLTNFVSGVLPGLELGWWCGI